MAISKIDTSAIANDAVTSTKIDDSQITLGFRNKIMGGNFSTNPWQRGTSFTNPVNDAYSADRWKVARSSDAAVDVKRTEDAPTVAQAGVYTKHCLHLDVTTADTSIGAGQYFQIRQPIEGYNLLDLGFGQSGTRYVTLSFWHKHTKTGTYSIALANSDFSRNYIAEYTQSTTNTWEKAEVTFAVDTTGTWNDTNGIGLWVRWILSVGSTYNGGTVGSWSTDTDISTSNQVNALDSTDNNFKIALVQLEAGQTATAFENRSVGQELELCQRYYQVTGPIFVFPLPRFSASTGSGYNFWQLNQPMRATPSVTYSGTWNSGSGYAGNPTFPNITKKGFQIASSTSVSANSIVYLDRVSMTDTQGILISAEL